jgi:hypothetical protein
VLIGAQGGAGHEPVRHSCASNCQHTPPRFYQHLPTIPTIKKYLNMANEDDRYGPPSHTCEFCNRCFPTEWETLVDETRLVVDLLCNGQEAIDAAKQGCRFFQKILYPCWPDLKSVRMKFYICRRSWLRPWGDVAPYLSCKKHYDDAFLDFLEIDSNSEKRYAYTKWRDLLGAESYYSLDWDEDMLVYPDIRACAFCFRRLCRVTNSVQIMRKTTLGSRVLHLHQI